jgi:hypothetical protein
MEYSKILAIGVGGFLGALGRYWVSGLAQRLGGRFPYGTLSVNLIGSFILEGDRKPGDEIVFAGRPVRCFYDLLNLLIRDTQSYAWWRMDVRRFECSGQCSGDTYCCVGRS